MTSIDYEESYFKLKKSNEDLTTLINKVINDLKQAKSQLLSEKDKNSMVLKRNVSLEKQLNEITTKHDAQLQELEDLRDEVASLKTYTKAVEGVAENYCGKNMETESKYIKLKRQSTIMFSRLATDSSIDININLHDEFDAPSPLLSPPVCVPDLAEIKKPYEDKLAKEKVKKINLRHDVKNMKLEMETLKENIVALNIELNAKNEQQENIKSECEILANSYSILKKDHEQMMQCFGPYLKMKTENLELRRTSQLFFSGVDNSTRILEFNTIIEELKSESIMKDIKIKELESQVDSSALTIELTTLKLQVDELNDKISAVSKERDTFHHENRILREQKGGPGVSAPPPPLPPPPPPPPPNVLLKLFKGKHSKSKGAKVDLPVGEKNGFIHKEKVLVDLMVELQRRLEKKVRNDRQMKLSSQAINASVDVADSSPKEGFIKLRSFSVPNIGNNMKETKRSELNEIFKKKGITPIDE